MLYFIKKGVFFMGYKGVKQFTKEELNFIKENYITLGCSKCSKAMGRKASTVNSNAHRLGLTKITWVMWQDWEKDIIRKYFVTHGTAKCKEFLPNRASTAIAKEAQKLGVATDRDLAVINIGYKASGLPKFFNYGRNGYICYKPTGGESIMYHRYVMEQSIGRKLLVTELVHHIDRDKYNNDISNLEIISRSEHMSLHWREINKWRLK